MPVFISSFYSFFNILEKLRIFPSFDYQTHFYQSLIHSPNTHCYVLSARDTEVRHGTSPVVQRLRLGAPNAGGRAQILRILKYSLCCYNDGYMPLYICPKPIEYTLREFQDKLYFR